MSSEGSRVLIPIPPALKPSGTSAARLSTRPSRVYKKIVATKKKPVGKTLRSVVSERSKYRVIAGGLDMTPKPLKHSQYSALDEKQQNALDFITGVISGTEGSPLLGAATSSMFISRDTAEMNMSASKSITQSFASNQISDLVGKRKLPSESIVEEVLTETAPLYEPPILPDKREDPDKVLLTISETPTIFLFEMRSHAVMAETEEGTRVATDNSLYESLFEGVGKGRRLSTAEVQTPVLLVKTQFTLALRPNYRNASTMATTGDMYDALVTPQTEEPPVGPSQPTQSGTSAVPVTGIIIESPDDQFAAIAETHEFLDACVRMERLLASNVYHRQQKIFKGLRHPDPYRLDVEYRYRIQLLWTFACDTVKGHAVVSMCWNTRNKDLLAVGYGKYFFRDKRPGLACVWCIKNPTQPERTFRFDSQVTAVDFSQHSPNLLAVGLYDGTVLVLDVAAKQKSVVACSNRETSPSYEPMWQVKWRQGQAPEEKEEQIMACGQDGRVCKYRRAKDFQCFPMMRVTRMEGRVKGVEQPRRCRAPDVPISRHPAAMVLTAHPSDALAYFVGTDEGCVHRCSTNYLHQHVDLFFAHNGPVYAIQFSPFLPQILLTCGGDWAVRVWAEGIGEPLITLSSSMDAVQDAAWSPVDSTIMASISGTNIHIWDMRRKSFVPASSTPAPSAFVLTTVQFTESGDNLVVGDCAGHVHVFGLTDMPFAPFYQSNALAQALRKALVTRPDLLKQLRKFGTPF